jgi:charged multivesicular body protein 2A
MGNVFGPEKPLKEIVRENQRMIRKATRELEKEISDLQKNEKKLIADIKKMAAQNQIPTVKIMAKDLVRTRNYIARFIEMKTQMAAVGLKIQSIKSHQAMAEAMKGVTKAMSTMNSKMKLPALQKIMTEFVKENEKSEMTQEMIGDTIDDAMEQEGSAADEEAVVGGVLAEIGIHLDSLVPEAPTTATAAPAAAEAAPAGKVMESPIGHSGGGGDPSAGVGGGQEAGLSELEARLNNLRRDNN